MHDNDLIDARIWLAVCTISHQYKDAHAPIQNSDVAVSHEQIAKAAVLPESLVKLKVAGLVKRGLLRESAPGQFRLMNRGIELFAASLATAETEIEPDRVK